MKNLVICPKSKGNTYNVAQYMKDHSESDFLVLEKERMNAFDEYKQIILCTGVYGDKIHTNLSEWLRKIDRSMFCNDVKFRVFLTWFGRGTSDRNAFNEAKEILLSKGLYCDDNYGSCYGGMAFIRRGHPNKGDLDYAINWMENR